MSWLRVLVARFQGLFHRNRRDRDLDDELRFHLDMQAEDNIQTGMAPSEARTAAQRRFGAIEPMKEEYRKRRTVWWLENGLRDVRYAVRVLRRSRVFTITAVLTLALALGANTAMVSVLDTVMLRPLSYRSPDELAMVFIGERGDGRAGYATVEEWRRQTQSFQDLAVVDPVSLMLTSNTTAERITVARVSPSYFTILGIQPLHGRVFSAAEASDRQRVAVVSHRLWMRALGGTPSVIGSFVELDGQRSRVVGVLPPDLSADADVWEPHTLFPNWDTLRQAQGGGPWFVMGRLKPGVPVERAQDDLRSISRRLDADLPAANRVFGVHVVPLSVHVVGHPIRVALLILMGAVLCVLLIAATNVASLSLARSVARDREMAVRAALGASRGRIVSQWLAESLTLSILSGALGLAVAFALIHVIIRMAPAGLPRANDIALNWSVLASTFGLSILTGLVVAASPLMTTLRRGLRPIGQAGGRTVSAGVAAQRIRRVLVVAELSLAIGLAVGAGLLIRSLWSLAQVDSGFRPERVLVVALSNPTSRSEVERVEIYRRVLDEVRALPGVERASVVSDLFVSSASDVIVAPEDDRATPQRMRVRRDEASGQLFMTVNTPLIKGRDFSDDDRPDAPRVAIINEAMARRLWPQGDPLGRRFTIGAAGADSIWWTVVGLVGDMRRQGPETSPIPQMFEALSQNPPRLGTLLIRTSSDEPLTITEAVRAAVRRADTRTPVYGVNTLESRLNAYSANRQFQTSLLMGFATVAVLLAAIGIYGLMHYSVTLRRQEIAMRLALGADTGNIFRMVVGEGLRLSAIGLAIGLSLALWIGRAGSSLLFGVTPTDPITFASVSILLTVIAAGACAIPAWMAMKTEPVVALRQD